LIELVWIELSMSIDTCADPYNHRRPNNEPLESCRPAKLPASPEHVITAAILGNNPVLRWNEMYARLIEMGGISS